MTIIAIGIPSNKVSVTVGHEDDAVHQYVRNVTLEMLFISYFHKIFYRDRIIFTGGLGDKKDVLILF